MSTQSTVEISRTTAIERIKLICKLAREYNYLVIFNNSNEQLSVQEFVDRGISFNDTHINKWTDEMLEEVMDKPFFRFSRFENYRVKPCQTIKNVI
jgi:1-deoxy-D-xylulose 5-phosphate reductoisomerase